MLKKMVLVFFSSLLVISMTACGGDDSQKKSNTEEKQYIEESQLNDVFAAPSEYEGQSIRISGEIYQFEEGVLTTTVDMICHMEDGDRFFVVEGPMDSAVMASGDVMVEGIIDGETTTGIDEYAGSKAIKIVDATMEEE